MDGEETEIGRGFRHRDLLAALGAAALRGRSLDALLDEASRMVAIGLNSQFAKVLEYLPAEHALLVRAGYGWREGVVGHAKLGADDASPAGYALHTSEPVLSNDLALEERFRTPALLLEHGVKGAINVIIQGDGVPFGVLEADCQRADGFVQADIAFLQNAANLLGLAVERSRRETELEAALSATDLLLREADHRIKNSLQLVASLLSMQRSRSSDAGSADAFDAAISRVRAVAEAHRALFQSRDLRSVAVDRMLEDICSYVGALSPTVTIRCQTVDDLEIDAERAIPLGLIVNELLTNAVRHAYPEGADGEVLARADRDGEDLRIVVADKGVGITVDPSRPRTLGGTIVLSLARQIGARCETLTEPGAGTTVTFRLRIAHDPSRPAA
jgi:two-component sensor histidine kinase